MSSRRTPKIRRRCGDKNRPVETLASVSPRIIHAGPPNVETFFFVLPKGRYEMVEGCCEKKPCWNAKVVELSLGVYQLAGFSAG
jgi:hypothetical protein